MVWCVSRCMQHIEFQAARFDNVTVVQQTVELAAIGGEAVAEVKGLFKDFLYVADSGANRHRCMQAFFEFAGAGNVVGVYVGIQDPVDFQLVLLYELNDLIYRVGGCSPRRGIEIEDGVDDHGVATARIINHVGDRAGSALIGKRLNFHEMFYLAADGYGNCGNCSGLCRKTTDSL